MKPEDKELLLKDLCARLPYAPIIKCTLKGVKSDTNITCKLDVEHLDELLYDGEFFIDIKPYLRPMSSMTDEEKDYVVKHSLGYTANIGGGKKDEKLYFHFKAESFDWLNKNMFDYRGLIPKDLALSTEEFNPYTD